jgi:hypothetical protein
MPVRGSIKNDDARRATNGRILPAHFERAEDSDCILGVPGAIREAVLDHTEHRSWLLAAGRQSEFEL